MELHEAQSFVNWETSQIRRQGAAAPAPNIGEALMAILLVLEDLMERVSALEPSDY